MVHRSQRSSRFTSNQTLWIAYHNISMGQKHPGFRSGSDQARMSLPGFRSEATEGLVMFYCVRSLFIKQRSVSGSEPVYTFYGNATCHSVCAVKSVLKIRLSQDANCNSSGPEDQHDGHLRHTQRLLVAAGWAVQIDRSLPHFPLQEWCDSPTQVETPRRFDLPSSGARDCASLSRTPIFDLGVDINEVHTSPRAIASILPGSPRRWRLPKNRTARKKNTIFFWSPATKIDPTFDLYLNAALVPTQILPRSLGTQVTTIGCAGGRERKKSCLIKIYR